MNHKGKDYHCRRTQGVLPTIVQLPPVSFLSFLSITISAVADIKIDSLCHCVKKYYFAMLIHSGVSL